MPTVYMVCEASAVDATTGQCTHVQYVQAPTMLPPLDAAAGAAIAVAIMGCWALAWVYKHL